MYIDVHNRKWCLFKKILFSIYFSQVHTMTMHITLLKRHCNVKISKNLTLWRDSNPGSSMPLCQGTQRVALFLAFGRKNAIFQLTLFLGFLICQYGRSKIVCLNFCQKFPEFPVTLSLVVSFGT
jgi:hypothetical protein